MLRREFGLCVAASRQDEVFIVYSTQRLLFVFGTEAEASIQVVESEMSMYASSYARALLLLLFQTGTRGVASKSKAAV